MNYINFISLRINCRHVAQINSSVPQEGAIVAEQLTQHFRQSQPLNSKNGDFFYNHSATFGFLSLQQENAGF